ncbi:hypothetical protein NBH19_03500 [Rhizobium sp. S95]|uniref:Uncharacterized protein n=1 Tax=Ciceribacter sichuanensis TaxID=2949647 RepID=A0AAJ1BSI1_9HYPH|nr:hypothetical protein [Ciceribacter sp. S95]MCO5955570.1 hypothetical protein [Ciceribacter sp. S101]
MTATKDKFFKPERMSAGEKARATDDTARHIIESEATARGKKTEKLRALRLAREAAEGMTAEPSPKAKKSAKKATTTR